MGGWSLACRLIRVNEKSILGVKSVNRKFGERVRPLRLDRGWSQEELAHRAGKHWTYVGRIERGERNPTLEVIADLAKGLRVRISELIPD